MRRSRIILAIVVAISCVSLGWALAQEGVEPERGGGPNAVAQVDTALGRSFAYQGYLTQSGSPHTGVCDFQFKLWDAATQGVQIGATQTVTQVALTAGRFTALVNNANQFGPAAFDGNARWLEVAARCSIAGGYTVLTPRQALLGVPYALGLQPGALVNGAIPGGGVLVLRNAADSGFALKSDKGGIQIETATDGVHVESALDNGFSVGSVNRNGLLVHEAGFDGVRVDTAGINGVDVDVAGSVGYSVTLAGRSGFRVGSAGSDGLTVDAAADNGVAIHNATVGVAVKGPNQFGVWIAPGDGADYAGMFVGDVQITGQCSGCRLSSMAINIGQRTLQPGEVVTVRGIVETDLVQGGALWQVVPFEPGTTPVGVVAGRAEVATEVATHESPTDQGDSLRLLAPRDGAAAPGDYVSIITSGPFQVQVAPGTLLAPGDYVLPAAGGAVQRLDLQTARVADMLSSIGIALSEPDDSGQVWVLINGH